MPDSPLITLERPTSQQTPPIHSELPITVLMLQNKHEHTVKDVLLTLRKATYRYYEGPTN